jgi:hypothetical protein
MPRTSGLGRKKEAAILALLSQRNFDEAARLSGVSARTLYRWLQDPAFAAAYREAKRTAFSHAIARLHQMSAAAVTTLGKAMLDASTPPATRVRAAHSILEHTARAIELEDISARLSELEQRSVAARFGD